MKKILVFVSLMVFLQCALITGANASEVVVRDDFGKYFEGFNGTFVMYDPSQDAYLIYNENQGQKRLSPCSTFKIFNSLIGLETGVLDREDVFTLIKWNGTKYGFPNWNRDHTLASATQESVVWYFQEVAARIGQERMQEYLDKIGYGNQDTSGGLTTFWLGSSLKISAIEQVNLLNKLYSGQLPFSADAKSTVLKNITVSDINGVKFLGKTGSGLQDGQWILGWFVGYIENQGKFYVVATNIEAQDGAFGGKAREITKAIAKDLGLL
jgi:bla regulator protein BlaR1